MDGDSRMKGYKGAQETLQGEVSDIFTVLIVVMVSTSDVKVF